MMANRSRKTTLTRVYVDDLKEIQQRFPKVTTADFFHMTTKTNPFIQVEAFLRKDDKKKQKR